MYRFKNNPQAHRRCKSIQTSHCIPVVVLRAVSYAIVSCSGVRQHGF